MYLEIILWRMFARRINGYYAMMQRSASSLFWDLLGLVRLFWRDYAASSWRGLRAKPPAGSDCLCRLPRLLQETVAPGPDAPVARVVGAPPGTASAKSAGSRLGRFAAALQRKRRRDLRARAGQLGWDCYIAHVVELRLTQFDISDLIR